MNKSVLDNLMKRLKNELDKIKLSFEKTSSKSVIEIASAVKSTLNKINLTTQNYDNLQSSSKNIRGLRGVIISLEREISNDGTIFEQRNTTIAGAKDTTKLAYGSVETKDGTKYEVGFQDGEETLSSVTVNGNTITKTSKTLGYDERVYGGTEDNPIPSIKMVRNAERDIIEKKEIMEDGEFIDSVSEPLVDMSGNVVGRSNREYHSNIKDNPYVNTTINERKYIGKDGAEKKVRVEIIENIETGIITRYDYEDGVLVARVINNQEKDFISVTNYYPDGNKASFSKYIRDGYGKDFVREKQTAYDEFGDEIDEEDRRDNLLPGYQIEEDDIFRLSGPMIDFVYSAEYNEKMQNSIIAFSTDGKHYISESVEKVLGDEGIKALQAKEKTEPNKTIDVSR